MKEIYFNEPLNLKPSIKNAKQFLDSGHPLHGSGRDVRDAGDTHVRRLRVRAVGSH